MFKLKEEFPFVTGDDDDAFSVKAGGIMDIAGNYAITDAGTGEEVVVLDEDYSLLAENWTIRDPDTGRRWRPFARRINCSLRSATSSPLRTSFRTSTRYSTPTATTSATSRGFSLRDAYTVTIDDASDVPKEAVIASACVLDALERTSSDACGFRRERRHDF